ncbi:hypothetical protein LCGC14_2915150, partial [marine sediment metagenome]
LWQLCFHDCAYVRAEDYEKLQERDRVIALSLLRSLCLSDHMGDAWNAVIKISKDIGFELPWPEDDECPDCKTQPICKACGGSGEIDDLPWKYLPKPCENCQEI